MRRWWRDLPDWMKIVAGLSITTISVCVGLVIISGLVLLIGEWI